MDATIQIILSKTVFHRDAESYIVQFEKFLWNLYYGFPKMLALKALHVKPHTYSTYREHHHHHHHHEHVLAWQTLNYCARR